MKRLLVAALLVPAACTFTQTQRVAGHDIPAPPGFKVERSEADYVCFLPVVEQSTLGVSFCARPLLKKGVLEGNTFGIETYPFGDRTVQVRGLASDGSKVADTIYLILETEDLLLVEECAGVERGTDLLDRCLPHRVAFNDWLRSIFETAT